MNLQDELTPEFLSWVLGEEVKTIDGIQSNALYYSTDYNPDNTINLDTLTRLIKEKILSQHKYSIIIDYNVDMFRSDSLRFSLRLVTRDGATKLKVKDYEELEACILAGNYVMENVK